MKKILMTVLLAQSFFVLAVCQLKINSSLSQFKLKGRVKSWIISYYVVNGDSGETQAPSLKNTHIIVFNKDGNETEISEQQADGRYAYRVFLNYTNDGLLKNEVGYMKDSSINYKKTYTYKGNERHSQRYTANGTLYSTSVTIYDNKGNEIESTQYLAAGAMYAKFYKKFDDKNNLIEYINYNPGQDAPLHVERKYDNFDNQIEYYSYGLNLKNGDVYFVAKIKYGNFERGNNPKEVGIYNEDGTLKLKLSNKYDFDAVGNYSKKTIFENDKLVQIEEQKIIYY